MELCQTSGSLRRLTFRIFTLLSFYLWHLTLVLLSYNWSLLNFIIFSSRFCRRKGTDSCFYTLGILSSCHLLNKQKIIFQIPLLLQEWKDISWRALLYNMINIHPPSCETGWLMTLWGNKSLHCSAEASLQQFISTLIASQYTAAEQAALQILAMF